MKSDSTWVRVGVACVVFVMGVCSMVPRVIGQLCGPQWLPGDGVPGTDGVVLSSTMWDPDGAGPQSAQVVFAGNFKVAGNIPALNIAAWAPETGEWSAFGQGLGVDLSSAIGVAPLANGDLIVGGTFFMAGGVVVNNVARWNGGTWNALGSGVNGPVFCVLPLPNGDVIVGGTFTTAGGVSANRIARWNGSTWSTLGIGINGEVRALTLLGNGDVVAAGTFTSAGGTPVNNVARWDGSTWYSLGAGLTSPSQPSSNVYALLTLPSGDLVAGGTFSRSGSVTTGAAARWDGATWTSLGDPLTGDGSILSLARMPNGDVVAGLGGIVLSPPGMPALRNVARWNGTTWTSLSTGLTGVARSLVSLSGGDVVASGHFFRSGDGVPMLSIARWNGSSWQAMGTGFDDGVRSMTTATNGAIVAAGQFRSAGAVRANAVATFDGVNWTPIGSGFSRFALRVTSTPNRELFAIGQIAGSNGTGVNQLTRWNGDAWAPFVPNLNAYTSDLITASTGQALTVVTLTNPWGRFLVSWNGNSWTPVAPAAGLFASSLASLANSQIAATWCTVDNDDITRVAVSIWNGSEWVVLRDDVTGEARLLTSPNGDLIVAGEFPEVGGFQATGVWRWNGTAWSQLGSRFDGPIYSLLTLPNGDVVAGGLFTRAGGVLARFVAVWNGTNWSAVDGGLDQAVYSLSLSPNGELAAGGYFSTAGGKVSASFARYSFSGIPTMSTKSTPDRTAALGQTVIFQATPSNGYSNVSVRWRRNGIDINDGPGGASIGGGVVSGATATLASPTRASTATLTITNVRDSDRGQYSAVFSNACGSVKSTVAELIISCSSSDIAGLNQASGADGQLTADDIIVFLGWFFASDSRADIAGPDQSTTPDTNLTADDIIVFLGRFFAGC